MHNHREMLSAVQHTEGYRFIRLQLWRGGYNMAPKSIYCRYEPNRFPISEFMVDKQGKIVFPYIHVARQPFHFVNGQLAPSPGGSSPSGPPPSGSPPGGTPIIPALLPPVYVPILPAMVDTFNEILEGYLENREFVSLAELVDFAKNLDLPVKEFNWQNLLDLNLGGISKEVLDDPEKLLSHFYSKTTRPNFGSRKDWSGGFGGSGGFGDGGFD
jgi:hypothetical protein